MGTQRSVYRGYTYKRRPVKLVYAEYYERLLDGFARERQLKRWSRAKKEALIEQDWEGLELLARSKGRSVPRPRGSTGSP